jgi:uncharacterized membrane protein
VGYSFPGTGSALRAFHAARGRGIVGQSEDRRFEVASAGGSIEVEVPVGTAYDRWTRFEEFPRFMKAVESVRQLDDTHLRWVAEISGKRLEWDAEITHQEPDKHIAWRATNGKDNGGEVRFTDLGLGRARIEVDMTWEPEGPAESVGAAVAADDRHVMNDLKRFKELVETRDAESHGWRGKVRAGETQ